MSWNPNLSYGPALWSGTPLIGSAQQLSTVITSTITADLLKVAFIQPKTSGILFTNFTSSFNLGFFTNGTNLSRNQRFDGSYDTTNTNLTTAFTNSIQSFGGVSELTAATSTVRLFAGDGISLEGGGSVNFNDLNAININSLTADNAVFSSLTASTFIFQAYASTIIASTLTVSTLTTGTEFADILNSKIANISTLFVSSLTGNAGNFGNISTGSINAGNIITKALSTSLVSTGTINVGNTITKSLTANTIVSDTGDFYSIGVQYLANINSINLSTSADFYNPITNFHRNSLSNVNTIYSGGCNLLTSNISLIATNAILAEAKGIDLDANEGALVAANARVRLRARNGNRGLIELDSQPGYAGIQGEINLTATGGSPPAGAPTLGGRIHLSATNPSPLTSVSPSYVLQTADSILAYAGGLSPIAGNYGYNYQQGLNGVNIVAGTVATIPNVLGTVYIYGTNVAGTGNSGGVRIQNGLSVDIIYPYPTGFITPDKDLILKGNAAGNKVSLSNVRNIQGDGGDFTGFYTLFTSNISANYLTGVSTFANSISTATLNVSTINGSPVGTINPNPLFSTVTAATSLSTQQIFVSTINGSPVGTINPNPLFSTVTAATSLSTQQIFVSTINGSPVGTITPNPLFSTVTVATNLSTQGLQVSSINGVVPGRNATFSTITLAQYLSTPQIFVSTINTGFISTNVLSANTGFISTLTVNDIVFTRAIEDFSILNTSTLNASTITAGTLFISTINAYNIITENVTSQSTILTSTVLLTSLNGSNMTIEDIGSTMIIKMNDPTAILKFQVPSLEITTLKKSLVSTTTLGYNSLSTLTTSILSTSVQFTTGSQEIQPFIPGYRVTADNVGNWGSTIFAFTTSRDGANNTLGNITTLSGGLVQYSNAGTIPIRLINEAIGGPQFTVPTGSNYAYTWNGSQWTQNTNPAPISQITYGTNFNIFQGVNTTTLQTPDTLKLDAAVTQITGATRIDNLTATNAQFQSTTSVTLSTNSISAGSGFISNFDYGQMFGTVPFNNIGILQSSSNPNTGQKINYIGTPQLLNYPWVSSLATTTQYYDILKYNTFPGGNFTLQTPSTFTGTQFNADGTITCPNAVNTTWISSIISLSGLPSVGATYNVITIPPNAQGEFIISGNQTPSPYGQYQINIGGTGIQVALVPGNYHKWFNLTGSAWTSNFSATAYPAITNLEDTFSIIQSPGGRTTFNATYMDFNYLPIVIYSSNASVTMTNAGGGIPVYARGTVTNIPIQYQGYRIKASDYVVTVSFSGYYVDTPVAAVSAVNANVFTGGDGYLYLTLTMDTNLVNSGDAHWYYDVKCMPKCIVPNGTNSSAPFMEKNSSFTVFNPDLVVSSFKSSTISMYASENIYMNAGINPTPLLGANGLIGLNASTNIDLMANNNINLDAINNILITADTVVTSNIGNTAFIGFDISGASFMYGSTISGLISDTEVSLISFSSNITATTPLTIETVKQPFFQKGKFTSTGSHGSNAITLPVSYENLDYTVFTSMRDNNPAQFSVDITSGSNFTVHWANAGGGSHSIGWLSSGDISGTGSSGPSGMMGSPIVIGPGSGPTGPSEV